MKQVLGLVAAIALLAACDDRTAEDWNGGGEGGGEGEVAVDGLQTVGALQTASFDDDANTLLVRITLDGPSTPQPYVRDEDDDLNGYKKFTQQDDSSDRAFTAFAKTSTDGSVTGVAISDGGNFGNEPIGGAQLSTTGVSLPANGLVSYAGDYVGVKPVTGVTEPGTVDAVTGTAFLNVEFADVASIEGLIRDRQYGPSGTGTNLAPVTLGITTINADGSFSGTATGGTYVGVVGGEDAATIGGAVEIGDEYGIFVLDQCTVGPAGCGTP